MSDFSNSHPHERDVFLEAVDIEDPIRKTEFLEIACADDEHLRVRVEALLGVVDREDLIGPRAAIRKIIENISGLNRATEGRRTTSLTDYSQ